MKRGWLLDGILVLALAALTFAVYAGVTHGIDLDTRDWVDSHRPTPAYVAARVLNYLGQGTPLAILALGLAVLLAYRTHSVRPVLPVFAAYLTLMFVVGPMKVLTDRAAPHKPENVLHREEFFSGGMSYPSGHTANTIVWYGVLVLLLSALAPAAMKPATRLALRFGPPLIVGVVTTYLGFHWITDTVAGLVAGLLLDRLLCRIDWDAAPLDRVPGTRRLAERGWFGKVPDLALR